MTTEVCEDSSSSFSSWWTGAVLTVVAVFMTLIVHIFGLISCMCLHLSWGSVAWRRRNAVMLC